MDSTTTAPLRPQTPISDPAAEKSRALARSALLVCAISLVPAALGMHSIYTGTGSGDDEFKALSFAGLAGFVGAFWALVLAIRALRMGNAWLLPISALVLAAAVVLSPVTIAWVRGLTRGATYIDFWFYRSGVAMILPILVIGVPAVALWRWQWLHKRAAVKWLARVAVIVASTFLFAFTLYIHCAIHQYSEFSEVSDHEKSQWQWQHSVCRWTPNIVRDLPHILRITSRETREALAANLFGSAPCFKLMAERKGTYCYISAWAETDREGFLAEAEHYAREQYTVKHRGDAAKIAGEQFVKLASRDAVKAAISMSKLKDNPASFPASCPVAQGRWRTHAFRS
ncbi:MAG TPA: hypothetical protein VEJ63_04210 [Planctomycetota bacterium]|nr:hypothetical protein [Planctomycetota bacterium]